MDERVSVTLYKYDDYLSAVFALRLLIVVTRAWGPVAREHI